MEDRSIEDAKADRSELRVTATNGICPAGEKAASVFAAQKRIPVLSCEGACIRGEIARLAANLVSGADGYARACHGETFTVPDSGMAKWVNTSSKVVVIDGCFLRCHGRILQNVIAQDALVEFDAFSFYKKYTEFFDIDAVPEAERKAAAGQVAAGVIGAMAGIAEKQNGGCSVSAKSTCSCGCEQQ